MKTIHLRFWGILDSPQIVFLGAFTMLLGGELVQGADCLQWIKRTDVGSYGQRWQHAMAYDSDRGVTVFFGGEIGKEGEETCFDDTQEYDGRQWRQISVGVKPPKRAGHMMAYDPVRKRVVMFGGYLKYLNDLGAPSFHFYADTWLYRSDGVTGFWEEQPQARVLPSTYNAGMVWDSVNNVVLLNIGNSGTWSWNGANWQNLMVPGPPVNSFGMAFDSDRGTTMIAGGFTGLNSTTADVWEKSSGGGWEVRAIGPSSRAQLAMAFHERRQRVMMVGGVGQFVETGETAFEYAPGAGWFSLPSLPSGQGRAGAVMVYDSRRGVMVLTGGAGGGAPNAGNGGRYSDTWELWPSLFISGQPSDTTNLVCSTTTFSVLAMGASPFQYQWRLDGAPLTDDAHFSGSRTADLRIDGLRQSHGGKYDVVVRDNCSPQNVVTSKVATLTIQPGQEWVLRATNGPSARFGHTMVYDSTRRVTVMFGGRTNWNVAYCLNDLWEWDGARWTRRMPNTVTNGWTNVLSQGWKVSHRDVPVQRAHHAMAYDSRRGRVVLFGGQAVGPNVTTANLRDLWEWDGVSWNLRATNGPIPRIYGSMTFDERRGRTVLFGGQPMPGLGETAETELVWEWDGERWHTNLPPANPSSANYRAQSRMTYDSFRGVIVFGPTTESHSHWAFWDWDGVKWSIFPVVHFTDPIVTAFHGTSWGGFDFDINRRRSTWFGGFQAATHNKTGFFDGKEWTLLTNSTPPPPSRVLPAMAYDSDRRAHVMFGGSLTYGGSSATNDTWELIAVDLPLINEQPASQYRVAGESATFTVSTPFPTLVAYQWYHGGTPVPGANTDTLTIPNVGPADAGEYQVLVSNDCGTRASRTAILTLDPKLQIFSAANTTTLIWPPAANLVLESAASATGPWTLVPNATSPFALSTVGPARFFRLLQVE
jgi:hypothetical protein